MAIGLILTAVTAYGVASNGTLMRVFYGSPMPLIVVAVATLGLVFALSAGIQHNVGELYPQNSFRRENDTGFKTATRSSLGNIRIQGARFL